jgi:hypothetical protein|nr:MAG TPA: HTH-type transcriptional regulator [Caudoviricetes sp.]
MGRPVIDLINKRFDMLVVLERVQSDNKKDTYWLCRCDCGNEKVVRGSHLRNGEIRSCGCLRTNDLTGKVFGRLTVLERLYRIKDSCFYYRCRCDCGNETIVRGDCLHIGNTQSCGCLNIQSSTTHGMNKTRFYRIWQRIKSRCYDKNRNDYCHYGGRGISMCDRWKSSFENFKEDMYESYLNHVEKFGEKNTSIDRIDVNGNYEPNNCRWSTNVEQANNKRNNHIVDCCGVKTTMTQASRLLGVTPQTVAQRLKNGKDIFGNPT